MELSPIGGGSKSLQSPCPSRKSAGVFPEASERLCVSSLGKSFNQKGFNQWAAFDTIGPVGGVGSVFTFNLFQNYNLGGNGNHRLGNFSLKYTTDSVNWNILTPASYSTANGTTLTLSGSTLLANGADGGSSPGPATDVYTVTAHTDVAGITGFRLNALTDISLPNHGPGTRYNGNFVLSEFQVTVVPEPYQYGLVGVIGLLGFAARERFGRKTN
jgi:hypothetical protein